MSSHETNSTAKAQRNNPLQLPKHSERADRSLAAPRRKSAAQSADEVGTRQGIHRKLKGENINDHHKKIDYSREDDTVKGYQKRHRTVRRVSAPATTETGKPRKPESRSTTDAKVENHDKPSRDCNNKKKDSHPKTQKMSIFTTTTDMDKKGSRRSSASGSSSNLKGGGGHLLEPGPHPSHANSLQPPNATSESSNLPNPDHNQYALLKNSVGYSYVLNETYLSGRRPSKRSNQISDVPERSTNTELMKTTSISSRGAIAGMPAFRKLPEKCHTSSSERGFSFSPVGLLIPYILGAAMCLQDFGVLTPTTYIAGGSAGAITTLLIGSQMERQKVIDLMYRFFHKCRTTGTFHRLNSYLGEMISEGFSEECLDRINCRPAPVTVSYAVIDRNTKLPTGARFVNRFDDLDDLAQVLRASCNIPLYLDKSYSLEVRGEKAVDAFFSVNLSTFGCPPTALTAGVDVSIIPFDIKALNRRTILPSVKYNPALNNVISPHLAAFFQPSKQRDNSDAHSSSSSTFSRSLGPSHPTSLGPGCTSSLTGAVGSVIMPNISEAAPGVMCNGDLSNIEEKLRPSSTTDIESTISASTTPPAYPGLHGPMSDDELSLWLLYTEHFFPTPLPSEITQEMYISLGLDRAGVADPRSKGLPKSEKTEGTTKRSSPSPPSAFQNLMNSLKRFVMTADPSTPRGSPTAALSPSSSPGSERMPSTRENERRSSTANQKNIGTTANNSDLTSTPASGGVLLLDEPLIDPNGGDEDELDGISDDTQVSMNLSTIDLSDRVYEGVKWKRGSSENDPLPKVKYGTYTLGRMAIRPSKVDRIQHLFDCGRADAFRWIIIEIRSGRIESNTLEKARIRFGKGLSVDPQ